MTESNSKTPGFLIAMPVLGAAGAAATYVTLGPERFWINWIYWLVLLFTIGMGALFSVALQHLVSARWSIPIRRVPERVSTLLLVATPIALLGLLAVPLLYPGAKPEALQNKILAGKAAWLSLPYFSLRTVLVFGVALISLAFFVRGSLKQDKSKDPMFSSRAKKYAPAFMAAFAFSVTIVAFDWIAGLVPEWYSDIFGVYLFAGSFLSSLSVTVLSIVYLKSINRLPEVRRDHLYSLGTFIFAFTVFWSYIAFAQYMLMWYANLPDEVNWYADRLHGGWHVVTITLAVVHFFIPFFVLSTRDAKSNPKKLLRAAVIMLSAHMLDVYWLIFPVFHKTPVFSWPEVSFALLFLGITLLWIRKTLGWGEDMPVGDPFLREGLEFHL
jgi:hypothetical protein